MLLAMSYPRVSASQGTGYELGVYVPRLMFSNNLKHVEYAQDVAAKLSKATGLNFNGRAFSRHRDLSTFVAAGRIDLVLADVGVIAADMRRYNILGAGTGPEGASPAYAVLAPTAVRGVKYLEGQRLVLPDASMRELSLISNRAFEGELGINSYFGVVQWVHDLPEIVGRLRTGRADCTVGYVSQGRQAGLSVVAQLAGIPLPLLAAVKGRLTTEQITTLSSALSLRINLRPVGPMTSLSKTKTGDIAAIVRAIALPPGQRPVRRAVWSPAPHETAHPTFYRPHASGPHKLPPLKQRWRVPQYPEL